MVTIIYHKCQYFLIQNYLKLFLGENKIYKKKRTEYQISILRKLYSTTTIILISPRIYTVNIFYTTNIISIFQRYNQNSYSMHHRLATTGYRAARPRVLSSLSGFEFECNAKGQSDWEAKCQG